MNDIQHSKQEKKFDYNVGHINGALLPMVLGLILCLRSTMRVLYNLSREQEDLIMLLTDAFVILLRKPLNDFISYQGDKMKLSGGCAGCVKPVFHQTDFSARSGAAIVIALFISNNGKACGPDKIPTTLVKDAANFISYPLTLIYNSSIKMEYSPIFGK